MWINVVAVITVILMVSIIWPNLVGAPWLPTPMKKVHKMLQLADVGPDDLVIDLGCGDGRIITTAVRRYGARAVGIEIDPLRYLWCQILITVLGLRGRIQIVYGNFFDKDLSSADVVTCYLLTSTNEKLQDKLTTELQPSARLVSHDFEFPRLQLQKKDNEFDLFLYRPGTFPKIILHAAENSAAKQTSEEA